MYCNMALISEESTTCNAEVNWFFDSGCSQHMTGNEQLLRSLEFSSSRRVMLGDGSHCIIRGQGRTTDIDQPLLEKVQLVEGLKANLISISRLCDDGCEVSFTNSTCKVLDAQGNVKFTGLRTEYHCYEWTSNGEGQRLQDDEFNEVITVGEDGWEEDEAAVIAGTVSTTIVPVFESQNVSLDVSASHLTKPLVASEIPTLQDILQQRNHDGSEVQQHENPSLQSLTGEIQGESSVVSLTRVASEVTATRHLSVTGPQQFVKQEIYRTEWRNIMQDEVRQLQAHGRDNNDAHWRNSSRLTAMHETAIHKTYLIAQGYKEVEGVFLNEVFPPMRFLDTIKFLVGVACVLNAKLHRLDVAPSEPAIYNRLVDIVLAQDYTRGSVNKFLFTQSTEQGISMIYIVGLHLVGLSTCQANIDLLFTTLGQQLEVLYHGELTEIFGLQIQQLEEGILVTQSEYIRQLMMRFNMEMDNTVKTPIIRRWNRVLNNDGEEIDRTVYMEMIGSPEFVTATRPELCLLLESAQNIKTHHMRIISE